MSQNDNAVLTAAVGYVYTAPAGTPRPTPDQISALDADTFGAHTFRLVSPVAVSADWILHVGQDATPTLGAGLFADDIQGVLEALPSVGVGNVKVVGDETVEDGFVVSFIGALHGQTVAFRAESDFRNAGKDKPAAEGEAEAKPVASARNNSVRVTEISPPLAWKSVGHTSRGDLPEFGYDGGDTEVRGTWQNESLKEIQTKTLDDFLKIVLHQFDTDSFELYYGKDASRDQGVFGVKGGTMTPLEKALLIIIVDGDSQVGFYSPKASIRRDDSISLKVDDFAALPIRATFLKHGSSNKFEWIAEDLFS